MEIGNRYQPQEIEEKWYKFWEENRFFQRPPDSPQQFSMVMPPPNITGQLHMGHALNSVIQDAIIRYQRMRGKNVLWLPGIDHGGIATQNVIEKELLKKGLTRDKLGREKFLEIMWEWRKKTGDRILEQFKKIGCSCDWERTRFTLDEVCSRAVNEAFVQLYNRGWIYRGEYIINWCQRCQTALSDIEVEHQELKGKLWYIKYPLSCAQDFIVVATTRPETMLGDSAIAVNPQDQRYQHLIGKSAILPILNREIPIVGDKFVQIDFGSGAVKVTPAHDPNDFEIAARHNLKQYKVIDEAGKMTSLAGKYQGIDRFKCRQEILEELKTQGLLEKEEDYVYAVGHCYRCHTVIEPLISKQWFLKTGSMAKDSYKVVKEGQIQFIPDTWVNSFLDWLENLKDWCISRQIWWGHQIPIWYCENKECPPIVSIQPPQECPNCGKRNLVQETDVLDTWFSSALWPFSTLGWPAQTEELKYYYPTSILVTGYEILYLWVARMIMMGITLKDEIPFKQVYIHGIVRDYRGKKMSKSLGNVIDPLEIGKEYGMDALRFGLGYSGVMGRDLQISEDTFILSRNFANKIWNAGRFILNNCDDFDSDFVPQDFGLFERWILNEYNLTLKETISLMENYELSEVTRLIYDFFWSKFCDWYLEFSKFNLNQNNNQEKRKTTQYTLIKVFGGFLKILHPFMPFISEEIWQKIKELTKVKEPSIMITNYPEVEENFFDSDSQKKAELIIEIIRKIRNIRAEMNIPIKMPIKVIFKFDSPQIISLVDSCKEEIKKFTLSEQITIAKDVQKPPQSAVAIIPDGEIYVPLEGIIDIEKEKQRLIKQISQLNKEMENINARLQNSNFFERAPQKAINDLKEREKIILSQIEKIKNNLSSLEK